jgi:antitoxin component YwqK of YwqJK toxin-antitoxin module
MILKKIFFIGFCCVSLLTFIQKKSYHKAYFTDGTLKEEGWIKNNQKNGYWKFYHENGQLKSEGRFKNDQEIKYWYFYRENGSKVKEGHFLNGKQNRWWLFYDDMGHINHKCQLKNNQKNGYCLMYKMEKLVKAAKYQNGKKIKEWTDFKSFKKENNLSDLRQ